MTVTKFASKAWNWAKNNEGHVFGAGLSAWFGADTYQESRESGDSKFVAAGTFAGEIAKGYLMGFGGYLAFDALTAAPSLSMDAFHEVDMRGRQLQVQNSRRAFQNSVFSDSEQAYTMRQAGMAIARRSRYNTQQAMLGNEAKFMMK